MILSCTCTHAYQDAAYGKNMRVHNMRFKAGDGFKGWRCTVCSSSKDGPQPERGGR